MASLQLAADSFQLCSPRNSPCPSRPFAVFLLTMNTFLLLAAMVGAEPAPLAVDLPSVDKGELAANKPLVHTFRLKNTTDLSITVTEISAGCGCFRNEVSERLIAPGKVVDLTVGMNLLSQPEGPNTWKLAVRYRVESNPPSTGERALQIMAKVKKDVNVEPVALMLLSEKEITGTLAVTDRRGKPLTVIGARIGLKNVTTEVKAAKDADGRRTQTIAITVDESCPAGQYADELCIDTDDPEYKELRIPVRVVKKAASTVVQALPASVTLRFAKEQTTASYLVRLRDAGEKEVLVEKAECDHPAVSLKFAAGPGAASTLRVTVDLNKSKAAGVAFVSVQLKGPKPETIVIPVSWTLP